MKLVLVPYILICWLLIKFGVVKRSLGNFVAMGIGGLFLMFMVLIMSRYLAFIDLTGSSTIKAPHIVLNSPAGGEIDKIFVTHNQKVKAGEPIYSFKIDRYAIQMQAKQAEISRLKTQLAKLDSDFKRLQSLRGDVVSQAEFDAKKAELQNQRELVIKAEQDKADLQWKIDHAIVKAPVDGQVAVVFLSEGQYFGESRPAAIHMFTRQKFMEIRIPDQVYAYIKPRAFAEFYVDAYPGKIFRARVHSVTESTGESQGSLLATPQSVAQHIVKNSRDVGRTVILEFEEPEGVSIPVGATGEAWIAAEKPAHILGFFDLVAGSLLRLHAAQTYLKAM
jgi:RND family efflux transporter MFP subunit